MAPDVKPDEMLKGSEKEMGQLFSLLRARTGVDFTLYKHSTLKRRIVRQMILQKLDALGKYVSFLEKQPKEVDNLFNDLLIYVTSFFRDPQAFQSLKKAVFPRLIKSHSEELPLRFWVCGCSVAYSPMAGRTITSTSNPSSLRGTLFSTRDSSLTQRSMC